MIGGSIAMSNYFVARGIIAVFINKSPGRYMFYLGTIYLGNIPNEQMLFSLELDFKIG